MGALSFSYLNPHFNFPRSYIERVAIRSTLSVDPHFDGDTIEWNAAPGYTYRVALKSNFKAWSSNVYSMDYIFDEAASSIDCHLFPCFDLVTIGFTHLINDKPPILWIQPFATPGDAFVLSLPGAPSTYWLEELDGF